MIQDTSRIEVRAHLRVQELAWVWSAITPIRAKSGQIQSHAYSLPGNVRATVSYRLGSNLYHWNARLEGYEKFAVDDTSRTVPCRIVVDDPLAVQARKGGESMLARAPRALMRGMFVQVTIHAQPSLRLVTLPEKAVHPGNFVYLMRDGELHEILRVSRARTYRGRVVIDATSSTLVPGDRVVVTPLSRPETGMKLREAKDQ